MANNKLAALKSIQAAAERREYMAKYNLPPVPEEDWDDPTRRAQYQASYRARMRFYRTGQAIAEEARCKACMGLLRQGVGYEHRTIPGLAYCARCLQDDYPPGGGNPNEFPTPCPGPVCKTRGACGCIPCHQPVAPLRPAQYEPKPLWEE